ncbi:DUF6522 family protein [Methylobacterium oxalidis]|uniref:Uncharacterized protein n=1 Tax=Methylobacterium oxalidis TaxID=944322 RepID=A0A512JCT1_9HYPH|nr:DUF6522 family protein [Methylobacterium oxalidis]GEP07763.1 hypothetical protein MOX02_58010 [Methylobacterium oxalidis]GLS66013.1 hypothetical protein GCM10007888_43950 [Methylobacterium oxalidis]
MRYDLDPSGNWVVDPDDLAAKLGLPSERLQSEMKLGLVRSRVERGSGDDEGRSRVTVQSRQAAWQGVFDLNGNLISERRW